MGGSSSKYNKHGGMIIQLENSSCFGGQETTGMIHLKIHSPIGPSTLYLIFKGKEQTHWETTRTVSETNASGQSTSRTVTDYHDGKAKVCNFHYPIYRWDYPLNPGGYSLPFAFFLPTNIPGSFHYQRGSTKADISYKFHAKLISVHDEKLKARALVQVRQSAYMYNANILADKHARMKTWCCCDKGECKISVVFPQDSYNPTQIANCKAEIDNSQSKLDVLRVSCSLISSLRLKCSSSNTFFNKETVISEVIPRGIPAGASPLVNSSIELSLNLPSRMQTLSNMHSTTGRLIDCLYTIEVKAEMDGSCMCCGDTPKVENIMKIIPNAVIVPSAPEAPPDWNPSVLQPISLQYDPKYEVNQN